MKIKIEPIYIEKEIKWHKKDKKLTILCPFCKNFISSTKELVKIGKKCRFCSAILYKKIGKYRLI
jgi:hypothetical protein